MNLFGVIDEIVIGMNLWFAPQISLHCPVKIPVRLAKRINWFIRPGIASTLIPIDGIVHEWITSSDKINVRIVVFLGIIRWFDVSSKRIMLDSFIKESNEMFEKSEYSYDQYHWWPVILIVREGEKYSSVI